MNAFQWGIPLSVQSCFSSLSSKVRHPVIETNMDSYYEIDRKLSWLLENEFSLELVWSVERKTNSSSILCL